MSKRILLVPKIQVHAANALSSPFTIGVPAMTAWLGVMHALERKLKLDDRFEGRFESLKFKSVAPVYHDFTLHTYRGRDDFLSAIIGTGNPLDENGNRPSFVANPRCDLVVSLLIEYEAPDADNSLPESVHHLFQSSMRIAGGDVISSSLPELKQVNDESDIKSLMMRVMPGYCLIDRIHLMQASMAEGIDAIDGLLDYLKITHKCEIDDKNKVRWTSRRKTSGWIVPIAVGFQGLTEPGYALHQIDPKLPHRFAESVVALGEFVMPYRVRNIDNILWRYHHDAKNSLYLCQPNKLTLEEYPHG